MKWLQANYEKAVLILIALVSLGVGVMHILRALNYSTEFEIQSAKQNNVTPEPPIGPVIAAQTILKNEKNDFIWRDSTMTFANDSGASVVQKIPLFDSTPIILHNGETVNLGDPRAKMLRPPVPNEWLLSRNLNILSANILNEDTDRDGFTNLEEYGESTDPKWPGLSDPLDPNSHPSYLNKVKYVSRKKVSLFLRFAAYNAPNFQINYRTLQQPNFASLQTPLNTPFLNRFTIVKYEPKEAMEGMMKRDKSELTVEDSATGKTFILVRQEDMNWPDYYGEFNFVLDPSQSSVLVKEGAELTLSLEQGKPYKVLELTETEAVLDDAGKRVVRKIGEVSPAPGGAPDPNAPPSMPTGTVP